MNDSFIAESTLISTNQRIGSILWVIFAATGILMSTTQIVIMCAWKPLRTLDHMLIFFVATSDFFKAIAHGSIGAHRVYLSDHGLYEARSQLECLQRILANVISTRIVMVSMLMISLDRLMALGLPVWYSQRKKKIKVCLIISSILIGVGYGSSSMIGARSDVYQLSCSVSVSPTPTIRKMIDYVDNLCCGVVVLINIISCSIVYWRLRKAVRANENIHQVKKHIQWNAVKTLVAVMILFLISVYANTAWNAAFASLPMSEVTRRSYGIIGGCANLLRAMFDFPIFLIMCREYRTGFRAIFLRKLPTSSKTNTISMVTAIRSNNR